MIAAWDNLYNFGYVGMHSTKVLWIFSCFGL